MICSDAECSRPAQGRGLCLKHYKRLRRRGQLPEVWEKSPKPSVEERFWSKVDKSGGPNACWIWTAGLNSHGYGQFSIDRARRAKRAHRMAYEYVNELSLERGQILDHICRNRICCNPAHLRIVTQKQNCENQAPARNGKPRGASKNKVGFQAKVTHNGEHIYIGNYATIEEAGEAARLKRIELYTHNDADRHPPPIMNGKGSEL